MRSERCGGLVMRRRRRHALLIPPGEINFFHSVVTIHTGLKYTHALMYGEMSE